MYAVGNVIDFIVRYQHMVGEIGPHILARAYNFSNGTAIMAGNVRDILGPSYNVALLFEGVMQDLNEMIAGLRYLRGELVPEIGVVLGIFFQGEIPTSIIDILKSDEPDSALFNSTLRSQLEERGITLEEHVIFHLVKAPTPPATSMPEDA